MGGTSGRLQVKRSRRLGGGGGRGPDRPATHRLRLLAAGLAAAGALVSATPASGGDEPGGRPRVLPETPVTSSDLRLKMAHNSPAIAADPTDGRFLALASRIDGPDFGCSLHVTADRGRLWAPARPVPRLPAGAERCYAPEVAFDGDGRLHYLFVGLRGPGNAPMGAFLTTSTDRARTFSAPRRVLGPGQYMVRMALDPTLGRQGRLHLVWLQTREPSPLGSLPPPPNPIVAAFSDDGGRSFSAPVQVSDPARRRVVAPALALGPGHRVHVLYYDLGDDARDYQGLAGPTYEGTWTVVHAASTDGGRRFGRSTVVDDGIVPNERVILIFTMPPPALAVDPAGRVLAAWTDARHGDWDVLFTRSDTGGRQFEAPRRLNDDPPGSGRHQYQPQLDTAPDGRVDAVFYDRRNDPANVHNDVYLTSSHDGGRTFGPNLRLTSEMSDTTFGQRYVGPAAEGLVEWGSRTGLLAQASGSVAAWTDTRVKPAARTIQQDVFSTRVVFPGTRAEAAPERDGGSGWRGGAPLAVAIALAGLVFLGAGLRRRRRAPKGTDRVAAVAVMAVALTACGGGSGEDPLRLPVPATVLPVVLEEYRFSHRREVDAGRVVFQARNAGSLPHEIVLTSLPTDRPGTIGQALAGPTRRGFPTVAFLPRRGPGATGTFAVDLSRGRYALICFVTDTDGRQHSVKGMSSELMVR